MRDARITGSAAWRQLVLIVGIGVACGLLACAGRPSADASQPDRDVTAVTQAIATYATSIDRADTGLAADVWATSSDVSFIHPRGHERGWEQIKAHFYEQTMRDMFVRRHLVVRDLRVDLLGDTAVAEFAWDFDAALSDGSPLKTSGRETQVYRKVDGRWTLRHVHYSGMPVTGARQGF
jgi:ketosteroid isomerase-like protein